MISQHRCRTCIAPGTILYFALVILGQATIAWSQGLTEATVHIDRAVIAYDEKNYDAALQELQEALRLEPDNVEALYYQPQKTVKDGIFDLLSRRTVPSHQIRNTG